MPDNPLWAHWYIRRIRNLFIMGLFSFTQEIAMDLGTGQYYHYYRWGEDVAVDEPSVVALDRRTDKMIAVW